MSLNRSLFLRLAAAGAITIGALSSAVSANANGLSWSIGVGVPGFEIGVAEPGPRYYEPAPVYSRPAPIYYQPAPPVYYRPPPPPPAYYQPTPSYYGSPAQVYYEPGQRYRYRHHRRDWEEQGFRDHRGYRDHWDYRN